MQKVLDQYSGCSKSVKPKERGAPSFWQLITKMTQNHKPRVMIWLKQSVLKFQQRGGFQLHLRKSLPLISSCMYAMHNWTLTFQMECIVATLLLI